MSFNLLKKDKQKKIEILLYILTIIFLLLMAFGNFARWPITEQLGIADNLEKYSQLYPNLNSENPYFTGGYFPGIAYFIYLLKFLIPDGIIMEVLLILSVFFIIFFFHLNKKIISEIYPNNIDFSNYWLLCIIFSFWLTRSWLWYAVELKSDIIAFSLCFLAFFIAKPYKENLKRNYFKLIFSIIIIAYAFTIKQQTIFLLFGMALYSLINKNYFFKFYSLITFCVAVLIYYYFYQNENLWFFTILRFSEDPIYTINDWLRMHYKEMILIILFIIFILFSSFHNLCEINFRSKLNYLFSNLRSNIWFYLIFFLATTGIISSVKKGGNTGNTEIALILFFPFIYIFIHKFKKSVLIFVAYALLIFEIQNVIHSVNEYINAKQFQSYIKKIKEDKNKSVLTDRYTYFASRIMRKDNSIVSLTTMKTLDKYFFKKSYNKDSSNIDILHPNYEALKRNYDYIILLGADIEKQIDKKYYIKLFSNKKGYVYKKIQQ